MCRRGQRGHVSTGVLDPLARIAAICERERTWFHVDGSLDGFGVLDDRVAHRYDGMAAADSLVLDPHKWLSVPIDCAVVLVKDPDELAARIRRNIDQAARLAGDVFVTGARVDGREAVRACFMHHGTTDDDVDRIVPAVLAEARRLAGAA